MTASDATQPATIDDVLDDIDLQLEQLAELLDDAGRDDLLVRVAAARARLARPTTVVCVVGEFKQGKSTLVNALVDAEVCPVDDDLATSAITLLRYGDQAGAIVRRRIDGNATSERVGIEEVARFVSESGNPSNEQGVERVDVSLPSPALADGLAIVDTPGTGGMAAGHGAATLAFLPFADGLVFVTDASSEFTEPELAFLKKARELCPNVMVALTKTDIAPEWRRIADIDRGHLAALGLEIEVHPVSSALRRLEDDADRAQDRSGFASMLAALYRAVIVPARETAAARIADEVRAMSGSLAEAVQRERGVLDNSATLAELEASVASAVQRIEHLRGPGAKWSTVLGDRVSDASNDISFRFRGDVRELLRRHEEAIETLKTSEQWDAQSQLLQGDVAAVVTSTFAGIEHARAAIRGELLELLAAEDESLGAGTHGAGAALDVASMWRSKQLDTGSRKSRSVQTGLTGLRGAQSGIMMFGMAGQFLPAATAVMITTNPVLLAVGAVFGTMQLVEDRKRKVGMRRQAARTQLRQFVDDVQFEVSNEIGNQLRNLQRDMRDEFSGMLGEQQRTWTESLQEAKSTLSRSAEEQTARLAALAQRMLALQQIPARVDALVEQLLQLSPVVADGGER